MTAAVSAERRERIARWHRHHHRRAEIFFAPGLTLDDLLPEPWAFAERDLKPENVPLAELASAGLGGTATPREIRAAVARREAILAAEVRAAEEMKAWQASRAARAAEQVQRNLERQRVHELAYGLVPRDQWRGAPCLCGRVFVTEFYAVAIPAHELPGRRLPVMGTLRGDPCAGGGLLVLTEPQIGPMVSAPRPAKRSEVTKRYGWMRDADKQKRKQKRQPRKYL